jgi:hypothetical protein
MQAANPPDQAEEALRSQIEQLQAQPPSAPEGGAPGAAPSPIDAPRREGAPTSLPSGLGHYGIQQVETGEHVPWTAGLSNDGSKLFISPEIINRYGRIWDINGRQVDIAQPLAAHEVGERQRILELVRQLQSGEYAPKALAKLPEQARRNFNLEGTGKLADKVRQEIYEHAHETGGDPAEQAELRRLGLDDAGIAEYNRRFKDIVPQVEKAPIKNTPPDLWKWIYPSHEQYQIARGAAHADRFGPAAETPKEAFILRLMKRAPPPAVDAAGMPDPRQAGIHDAQTGKLGTMRATGDVILKRGTPEQQKTYRDGIEEGIRQQEQMRLQNAPKRTAADMPPRARNIAAERESEPAPLGAAATPHGAIPGTPREPFWTRMKEQASTAFRSSLDKLMSVGRDLQMKASPMATGSRDARAMVKDHANLMRRVDQE